MHPGKIVVYGLVLSALVGCGDANRATVLHYVEQDQGGAAYRTRVIVTSQWLRIDEGPEGRDFLLFDRREKTLYSVNTLDSRVLVMTPKAVEVASPMKLEHRVERDDQALPAVGDKKVTHYRLWTNQKPCYDLFAAEGLLPGAVQALREYREALAGQQSAALPMMPQEFQTPCDLANNIFAPARYLEFGLPVRLNEIGLRVSELVDFQADFAAPPGLFELPAGFQRQTLEGLRGQ